MKYGQGSKSKNQKRFKGNSLGGINPWELPQIKRAVEIGIGQKTKI